MMFAENLFEFSGMVYDSVFKVLCCLFISDSLYRISHQEMFVNNFFYFFFKLFKEKVTSCPVCVLSSDSLLIILHQKMFVNNFFQNKTFFYFYKIKAAFSHK